MKRLLVLALICVFFMGACCLTACGNKSFTVRFDPNYEGAEVVEVVVAKDDLGKVPVLTREGYYFDGWFTDKECTSPAGISASGTVIGTNNTYYAKWSPNQPDAGGQSSTGNDAGDNNQTPNENDNGNSGDSGDNGGSGTTPVNPDQGQGGQEQGGTEEPSVTLTSISATYAGAVKRGAALDKAAVTVTATYSDGSEKVVTAYALSQDYAAMNDEHSVTVRYQEGAVAKECTMTYEIVADAYAPAEDGNVYFTNIKGWDAVYAYAWSGDGESATSNAAWPGEACAFVATNEFAQAVYAYDLTGKSFEKIIFNNRGQGEQTVDITLTADVNGYYPTDKQGDKYDVSPYQDKYVGAALGTVTAHEFTGVGTWAKDGVKKVHIYTPAGYDAADTTKQYKVLYMFDGQNLFDRYDVEGGSATRWGVNTALAVAGVDCIVVGVDNGEDTDGLNMHWRDKPLTMAEDSFGSLSSLTRAGGNDETAYYQNGTLDLLGDFIRNTLIPYINANYNVYTGREDTLIAGSSSGGLAAFYLGLRDSDLYSVVGAFSPATALFDLTTWQAFLARDEQVAARAYPQAMFVYCGHGEGSDDLENALYDYGETAGAVKLEALLRAVDYDEFGRVGTSFTVGAVHNEGAWRAAFKTFIDFAF